jgi:sugar phosphate isomerase/epimerase
VRPRFGCSPALWGEASLAEILEACAATGFVGLEQRRRFTFALDDLCDRLGEAGLQLCAVTMHEPWYEKATALALLIEMPAFLESVQRLSVPFLVVSVPGSGDRIASGGWSRFPSADRLSVSDLAYMVDSLHRLAELAAEAGLRVAFRPRLASYVETLEETEALLEMADPELVLLALDLGHLALMEIDPVPLIQRHRERIGYCYLRDLIADVADQVRHAEMTLGRAIAQGLFVAPGQGSANLQQPLRELWHASACEWLVLDLPAGKLKAQESMEQTRAYITTMLGA